MVQTAKRHPFVKFRKLALSEPQRDVQQKKGLFVTERGEPFAIPVDKLAEPRVFLNRRLWRNDATHGVHRPGVKFQPTHFTFQKKALAWLGKHVHKDIPYWYYLATLGHDLHVSTWGELYGRHWHQGWANPFEPERLEAPLDPTFESLFKTHWVEHECDLPVCVRDMGLTLPLLQSLRGFTENLGLLASAKVTDAFVSEEIDELVSATGTEYADFDSHEVGTDNTAEDNNDTALGAAALARVSGTPTDSDPIYQNVGTITADTTETWEEHGLFNNTTGAALMDRSLTGGQSVENTDQVEYTYQLTKAPES